MKNRKIKVSLLVIISILVLYYILSILFVRNGQFVNYYFPAQLSVENSIYNKNFIRKITPNKIKKVNIAKYEEIKDGLEIYICEAYYYKSYGMLNLFKHKMEFRNSICLNVNSTIESKLFIKYDQEKPQRIGDSNSYWNIFKIGSNVRVQVFDNNQNEIFEMFFFNLKK